MIKIKKYLRSKDDEGLNDYIEQLENYFLELKASNTLNLIFKLDEMNGAIVEDLEKIINGEAVEEYEYEVKNKDTGEYETKVGYRSSLKLLNDDKESKAFDRVMVLYSKLKDLKAVSDMVSQMIPEVEDKQSIKDKVKLDKSKPILEQLI